MAKKLAAGANAITWNGRIGAREARAGSYGLFLSALGAGGQRTIAESKLRLR